MAKPTFSVSQLADLVEMDRRTLSKRLQDLEPASQTKRGEVLDRRYHLAAVIRELLRYERGGY
jgi:hypothetical protein